MRTTGRDAARRLRTAITSSGIATSTPEGRLNPAINPQTVAAPHRPCRAKMTAQTIEVPEVNDSA